MDDEAAATEPVSATPADRALPAPTYEQYLDMHEEQLAAQRLSAIEAGRRKGGVAGAAMAGAMLVVSEIYEGPRKDDKPVTVEASSDPNDVDRDGIDVSVGAIDVSSPALPRVDPVVGRASAKPPQV